MNRKPVKIILATLAVAALAGCAAAPKDSGFAEVRRVTSDRTGVPVQWNHNSDDDKAVRASVQRMLTKELTAEEAVQIALLNNRNLQATFEDLGVAQADFVQAGLLKNPVFDLNIKIPDRSPSRTYVDFSVAEDFVNVFFIPARRNFAGAQFEQVTSRVTGVVLTLAADTKSAFYTYQGSEQLVALRRSIAAASAASAEVAKRLHDAGNTTDLDYANAKVEDGRAKIDQADAQADAAEARERLNQLMGLWGQDTVWTISNRLPELPISEIQPVGLESVAIRQRPDLVAARQEIKVQALALGFTSETRLFTDITVGGEGERETDGQWRVGPNLSIPIPIFDQGQAAIPRAEALLRQSEQRYWALAVDVRSEVRAARTRMFSARAKSMLYHDQLLPLQQQAVQQTQLQYNGMLVGVFQLLQARRDEIEVAREYIDSLRDYWTARAALERALGGKFPLLPPSTMPAVSSTWEMPEQTSNQHQQ